MNSILKRDAKRWMKAGVTCLCLVWRLQQASRALRKANNKVVEPDIGTTCRAGSERTSTRPTSEAQVLVAEGLVPAVPLRGHSIVEQVSFAPPPFMVDVLLLVDAINAQKPRYNCTTHRGVHELTCEGAFAYAE